MVLMLGDPALHRMSPAMDVHEHAEACVLRPGCAQAGDEAQAHGPQGSEISLWRAGARGRLL